MAGLKIVTIMGSARKGRNGERLLNFFKRKLAERKHELSVLDPIELNLPMLDRAYHFYPSGEAPEQLKKIAATLMEADAFLIISPEYNHSIPPALSNLMGHFPGSCFAKRPSAIACYSMGPYGGMRVAMQLRSMLGELQTPSIPNIFGVPVVQNLFSESGVPTDPSWESRAVAFLDELEWYAKALKAGRTQA